MFFCVLPDSQNIQSLEYAHYFSHATLIVVLPDPEIEVTRLVYSKLVKNVILDLSFR